MKRTAEIAGAGFAGLTVAIELARRGWTVSVHEQSDTLRAFGAGIFLWENGLQVLSELGLEEAVLARAHQAPGWEERTAADEVLRRNDLPLPGGVRMITLTRQDLHTALLTAARDAGVGFRTGSPVIAAEPGGILVTRDGTRRAADLVVAADGIRSAVRTSLDLLDDHTVFPFTVLRFLVPMDRVPDRSGRWRDYVGFWNHEARRRVLYVPCNADDLYLLLGALPGDPALEPPLDPRTWAESFPPLREVFSELPDRVRQDRYEAIRTTSWSAGRVALIGDAAHAMPPTIGQGAGTAMLNALNLARAVDTATSAGDDLESALKDWEAENRPMTEQTQRESVEIAGNLFPDTGHRRDWSEATLQVARNRPRG